MNIDDTRATVLIVDDLKSNIEVMADSLCDTFEIATAGSGSEALEILRANPNVIDVILLDMIMPRMNGCEFLEEMKSEPAISDIPVIIVTTDDDPYTKLRAFDLGAVDFVQRGTDVTVVKHRINNVLRLRGYEKMSAEVEQMRKTANNEHRFTAFMDNIPGGVAIIRTDGVNVECSYFNSEMLLLFGMTGEEFKAQFTDTYRPEWLKTFVLEQGYSTHFSYIFPIGDPSDHDSCQWIRIIAGKLGETDGVSDIYCVFLDSNDEKRHEMIAKEVGEKLRANEDRLEALLNNSPGGIAYAERDSYGRMSVMFVNRGLAEMLEYPTYESCIAELSADPTVGLTAYDVSVIRKKLEDTLTNGGHLKHTFNCTTKNGNPIWLMVRGKPMLNADGNLCLYAFITNTTKEKKIEQELRSVAYFDSLTGLYNRSAFIKNVRSVLDENPLMEYSLMKLNIGSFKTVNDLLGRELGDKVLCTVSDVLRSIMGNSGIYARFFADNFVMLVPYSERSVHPQMIIDAMKNAVQKIPELTHEIQFYLGVYRITDKSLSIENMTDRASIACRSINGSYREHIAYYDEKMRLQMLEEQEICDESRRALDNGEFYVCYQPVYGIKARRFVSAEALVRWNHPTKGMIPPGKFIPVFEKNGFIAELDLYILEQVCIYQKKRMESGLEPFPISVNISRMSMYNPKLFDIISELTNRYHVDPKNFRIEITESAYNDNPSQLLETVGRLRGNCFPVLMDDFGSGYSSLNTLKDIPIDILKLDMQFMQGFEKNGKVGTIVTSIARMSKWLNVPMLAEGVETREQYEFLASIGCSYIQGFYFSRPVPEAEFTMLIEQDEVVGESDRSSEENIAMSEDINELLGSNPLVSRFIDSVCGGLGIYELIDGRLELIRANEGYMQIMGYSSQESIENGANIWNFVHPEDVEISRSACMEAARTDKAVRATVRRYAKSGKLLTLEGIHRKLGGTDENPIFCIAFSDITDRIKSDRLIERSNSRAEELMNSTGSLFIDIDYENDTVYHTGSYLPFGIDVQHSGDYSQVEQMCRENIHPDDEAKLDKFKHNQSDKRYSDELRMKGLDGEYHWWRFTHVRTFDDSGKITRLIAIVTLIDVEKSAQREYERMKGSVFEAVDGFDTGVVVLRVSKQGKCRITYSNDSFWRIIGRKRAGESEFMSTMISAVSPEDCERLKAHVESGSKESIEYTVIREDGTTARVDARYAISENPVTGERVFVCFFANITDRYENRIRLHSIVDSYSGGIALVNTQSGVKVEYANDNFYSLLGLGKSDDERIKMLIKELTSSDITTRDMRIRKGGDSRVIRARVFPAEENGLVIRVSDVTRKRSELKDRINERMENASAGLYDMVFELNLRMKTVRTVSTRKDILSSALGRPMPVDSILKSLVEKFIIPADAERFREIFEMPFENPDFTDAYREISFLDPEAGNKYTVYGITLVRAKTDTCMLFCRDKSRVDSLVANSKVADLSRLYRIVAERAKITIIEVDHVTNRRICSPSIEEYWASKLSVDEFYENFRDGLAVYDDDKKAYSEYIESLYNGETPSSLTLRLKMADESYKWCELTITLTWGSGRKLMRSLCIIKQLDRELAEQKRQYKGMEFLHRTVNNIPVGLGIFRLENAKPIPVYISDKIYDIFGIGNRNMDIPVLPIESLARHSGLDAGAEGSFSVESMKADGKRFELGITYNIAEEDGETLIYAIFSDITEQIDNRRHSTAENEMYSMLLYETGTIIFNYNTNEDKLSYSTHEDGKPVSVVVLNDFLRDPALLTFINADDLGKFTQGLNKLCAGAEHEEFLVRLYIDEYPRRYKVFMKSVRDEDGKIFAVIGKMEDVDDELAHIEKIEAKAMFDPLCIDVYNKATTEELIRAELDRGTGGVLMMLDVDDFKSINDNLGHLFGDEFLKRFATTIKNTFRTTDIVGRYGGDEFIVFLPRATASLAKKKGWHILDRVHEIEVPKLGAINSSIGAAVVNPSNRSYSEVFKQADTALYQAKNHGKNRVEMFNAASMSDGTYRTKNQDSTDKPVSGEIMLSSNPSGASSLMMRVFSALYSSVDVDAGISQMLELMGKTYDVSRVYIFEDSEDGSYCSNTFEWCGEGIEPVIDTLQKVDYEKDLGGKFRGCFNDDGIIYCQDIAELPPEVGAFLDEQGVKSVLHCSILDAGEFKGFLGFDECRNNRFWTQEQIDSLVFLSKIISVFLMKRRTEQKERLT